MPPKRTENNNNDEPPETPSTRISRRRSWLSTPSKGLAVAEMEGDLLLRGLTTATQGEFRESQRESDLTTRPSGQRQKSVSCVCCVNLYKAIDNPFKSF